MLVSWTIATAARGELRGEGNLLQRASEFTQAEQETYPREGPRVPCQ